MNEEYNLSFAEAFKISNDTGCEITFKLAHGIEPTFRVYGNNFEVFSFSKDYWKQSGEPISWLMSRTWKVNRFAKYSYHGRGEKL